MTNYGIPRPTLSILIIGLSMILKAALFEVVGRNADASTTERVSKVARYGGEISTFFVLLH